MERVRDIRSPVEIRMGPRIVPSANEPLLGRVSGPMEFVVDEAGNTVGPLLGADNSLVGVQVNGGQAALLEVGVDAQAYSGVGQTVSVGGLQAPGSGDLRDRMVVFARLRFGPRPYWSMLLSDRVLALNARQVELFAAEMVPSEFGFWESPRPAFNWSGDDALLLLLQSVGQFADSYTEERDPPSVFDMARWWRRLSYTVAQWYAGQVAQVLQLNRALSQGNVNPTLLARPRMADRAMDREINASAYNLEHPWGHSGHYPMR